VVFAIMPILTSTVGANISLCGARLSWLRSTVVAALGVALQKAFDDGLIANGDDIRHDRGVGREMGTKEPGPAAASARSPESRVASACSGDNLTVHVLYQSFVGRE